MKTLLAFLLLVILGGLGWIIHRQQREIERMGADLARIDERGAILVGLVNDMEAEAIVYLKDGDADKRLRKTEYLDQQIRRNAVDIGVVRLNLERTDTKLLSVERRLEELGVWKEETERTLLRQKMDESLRSLKRPAAAPF